MKDFIHFAHGNGFPSLCYMQMLSGLEGRFDIGFIDRVGHDPLYPVTENWQHLVHELIASIKKQTTQPVIGVGHSLGGVLSFLAAIEEPELFKAVILLDSPIIGRFKSNMIRLAKSIGIIDRVTPAFRTKGRRGYWKNKEVLVQYLKSRELFKTFTENCLNDYIAYGLELKKDGYYLRFDKHIEYEIFRTLPHTLSRLEGTLHVPAALIFGDKSTVVTKMDVSYMKKRFKVHCFKTKGTHLFPMEHPFDVAKQIITAVDAIL